MSIFQRLIIQGFPVYNLDIQYRMHSHIVSFPNRRFYAGALKTAGPVLEQLSSDFIVFCQVILKLNDIVSRDEIRLQ